MTPNILSAVSRFLGVNSLNATGRDAYLVITLRSLRMFSAGIPSLILALFFSALKFPDTRIGLFMTLTLLGDVVLSLVLTLVADQLGRRRILLFGSFMMVCSGTAFALSENFWVLLVAAVFGVISVTGADTGPFRAVEESILSGLTDEKTRSDVLTWYVTSTTLAGAIGSEVAGRTVTFVEKLSSGNELHAFHVLFWGYAGFGVAGCVLSLMLSSRCEMKGEKKEMREVGRGGSHPDGEEEEVLLENMTPTTDGFSEAQQDLRRADRREPTKKPYFSQISAPTRHIMFKLWILLAIDSLADGMTPYSLINYYMDQKFQLSKAVLGDITSASQFLCAVSSIFAGPLSKRIGLINTMVFTHLPSSIASAFVPLPKSVGWTVGILLFRAALNSMDQAPRTAFIAAVVKPEERTAVMGITSMARILAMSVGPSITGLLAGSDQFWAAFLGTGIARVVYDVGLWVLFINVKVDGRQEEERQRERDNVWDEDGEGLEGLLSDTESENDSSADSKKDEEELSRRSNVGV